MHSNNNYNERVLDISLHDDNDKKKPYSQLLVEITNKFCILFHNDDQEAYAKIDVGSHKKVWAIKSRGFKMWLGEQFHILTDKGVNSNSLKDALSTIEAKAVFNGDREEVHLRVAQTQDAIYIDICNDNWEVIKVTKSGYKILKESPVAFIRSNGMQPLVKPQSGGDIKMLKELINVKSEDFPLLVGWLLMTMQAGEGAMPILILMGEQNTGKSEISTMLRQLSDPHSSPIRTLPTKEDHLAVMAFNNYVMALDNLSGITPSYSDFLCCCSTGASQSKRQHYADTDEILIKIKRPIIANGIDDIARRGDLASRSVIINLPILSNDKRKSKKELWGLFNKNQPLIYGVLLEALSHAMRNIDNTTINNIPRMADFALWVKAAEGSFGWKDKFMPNYQNNIDNLISSTIDGSPFATGVVKFMTGRTDWEGSAQTLLDLLESDYIDIKITNKKNWIQTPKKVMSELRRHSPAFKTVGIDVKTKRESSGNVITITRLDNYHNLKIAS